jgi:[ribosomal protein S5]-alanine N-acetyltransferase
MISPEKDMPLIESERLYVRYYTMDDLDNFCRLNRDEEVMRYIRAVKSREETIVFFKEVIARYQSEPLNLRLALLEKETDLFIGSFAIIPLEKTYRTQLGYSLLKEHWGKGYATEIVNAGLKYIFSELNLPEISAVTMIENIASQNVLLKTGFVFEKAIEEEGRKMNVYRKLKGKL